MKKIIEGLGCMILYYPQQKLNTSDDIYFGKQSYFWCSMHEFDAEELKPFIDKLQKEQEAIDAAMLTKMMKLLVSKYKITTPKISRRNEERMKKDMNFFKLEVGNTMIYAAFKIVINPGKGIQPKSIFLIERKTKKGRVFQFGLYDMYPMAVEGALFFTSHLFDRMILRGEQAENRYQAIKLVLGEFLLNMFTMQEENLFILIGEENGYDEMIFPNRYGCCLGQGKDGIALIKTFIGVNMLRPKQRSIHQAYMTSVQDMVTAFDTKTFKALANQRSDEDSKRD